MGKLITTSATNIRPSQDFLKKDTIERILTHYKKGALDKLPPTPIVRYGDSEDDLIAIDGHNLIAVWDYLDKPVRVFVAESEHDNLTSDVDQVAIVQRNKELADKYEHALLEANELRSRGITTFKQLRQSYPIIAPTTREV